MLHISEPYVGRCEIVGVKRDLTAGEQDDRALSVDPLNLARAPVSQLIPGAAQLNFVALS
jgi:hypothetical protein